MAFLLLFDCIIGKGKREGRHLTHMFLNHFSSKTPRDRVNKVDSPSGRGGKVFS
jgi:hypothetical protein